VGVRRFVMRRIDDAPDRRWDLMPGTIRRAALGTAFALVLAGCAAAVSSSPSAPASPSFAPSVVPSPQASASPGVPMPPSPRGETSTAACVNPPPNIAALSELADPVSCYGNAPLTLDAHLVGPAQVDYVVNVEPAWLGEPSTYLDMIGETSKNGPFMLAAVAPAIAASLSSHLNSNVRISGHFDDPAAQTCREIGRVPGMGTPEPPAGTIEHCRSTFVITDLVPLGP
jgi:hypothetical protein